MNTSNPEFISRYERIYQGDPDNQIFAPLSEAYRKSGQIEKAFQICRRGVARHPNFASGHVTMAKIYIDMHKPQEAIDNLRKATQLAPTNILAHQLLAELYMQQKRPKAALRAYKMVLLNNPADLKTQKAVEKLEALTADEYEDNAFQMIKPAPRADDTNADFASKYIFANSGKAPSTADRLRGVERVLTLADAFLVRNELDKASELLKRAQNTFGSHPEIQRKMALIKSQEEGFSQTGIAEPISPIPPRKVRIRDRKLEVLEALLQKVQTSQGY